MKTSYLDRETSNALKGIALIFMFIHHFFTFPEWYIAGISYPELSLFARYLREPFKICVSVFAFMTGYFYFFGKQQTFRYSLRKITDILISYWAAFLPLLALALILGCWQFDLSNLIKESLGLKSEIMVFCWYVYFYCISMLLLPIVAKLSTDSFGKNFLLFLVLPVAAFIGLRGIFQTEFPINSDSLFQVLASLRDWFPCIISGYLFAKHALFENFLDDLTGKFHSQAARVCVWIVMACAGFLGRVVWPRVSFGSIQVGGEWFELLFTMDIVYAPLFVYGMANLWRYIKNSIFSKLCGHIGSQSLLMWFLHCLFFGVCKEYTMPILYFPRNPILVLIWGLLLCYAAAAVLNCILKPILAWKNKYLFSEKQFI